jgi:hypothetical protein
MIQKLANKFVSTLSPEEFRKRRKRFRKFAYFCEVTYTIDQKFHDKLSKLPPLISKKQIKESDLSINQKK